MDTAFVQHIEGALAAGMEVGVYHAFISSVSGEAQADFYEAAILPYLPRLAFSPAIDVELDNGQEPEVITDRLYGMCRRLETRIGALPMIYSSPGFWNANTTSRHDDYFATLPLWNAHWTDASKPILPRSWKNGTWTIWQYGKADVTGVVGKVDVNRRPQSFALALPVDSPPRITQVYGANYDYYMENFGLPGHEGVDMGGSDGANIYASADGTVKLIARDNGVHAYGNHIRISHADGYETIYAHLRGFVTELTQGDSVRRGQVIGYMGSSGNSTGTHLHFSVKHNGAIIDPEPLFSVRETA